MPAKDAPSNPQVIVLFDACMPHIKNCRENGACAQETTYFCRHRFKFKGHFFYTHDLRSKDNPRKGARDFEIVLYFFNEVIRKRAWWPDKPGERQIFVLATKDDTFLQDACSDSDKVNHPDIEFKGQYVKRGNDKIFIQLLKCQNYGPIKTVRIERMANIINCCIEELNKKWAIA